MKKKGSFTETMHRVTSQSQWWQNYINCTSNCFHTHCIIQICPPPTTTSCLQTSKEFSRDRFGSNEEVIFETEVYFEAKDKLFNKKHWIVRSVGIGVSPEVTMLMNKVEFCLKVVLLVWPGTYWVMLVCLLHTKN